MGLDTLAIIVAIVGTGIGIVGTGIGLWRTLDGSLREIRRDVGDLRERMARIEGLFEGFTGRQPSG